MEHIASDDAYDADVVVVGSGFGGAVTALRLAEAGHRVMVLAKRSPSASPPASPRR